MKSSLLVLFLLGILLCSIATFGEAFAAPFTSRAFTKASGFVDKPKLILISGCSGTGKSTFGMSVALDQGILKCISTDTLRSVMRSFIDKDISPALHRSSYAPGEKDDSDDPVKSWKQTCSVLQHSVDELVDEMIARGASIVIEGVHVVPSNDLIQRWESSGGVATGIVLQVPKEEDHKSLLMRRGVTTGKGETPKLDNFHRIRAIHDEMVRLGREFNWVVIEQNVQPDPLEIVASRLWQGTDIKCFTAEQLTSITERRTGDFWVSGGIENGKAEETQFQENQGLDASS